VTSWNTTLTPSTPLHAGGERRDVHLQIEVLTGPHVPDIGNPHVPALGLCLLDVVTQLHRPVGQVEITERTSDVARRHPEQVLGLVVHQRDPAVRGEDDLSDRRRHQGLVA
jgi:hypothetical protein